MRTIRLLPIVVVATSALFVFKSIDLITGGSGMSGFGVTELAAEETEAPAETAGDASLPSSVTLSDTSPTLADTTTTLALGEVPEEAATEEPEAEAPETEAESTEAEATETDPSAAEGEDTDACPTLGPVPAPAEGEDFSGAMLLSPDCVLEDAVATILDSSGRQVPLSTDAGGDLTERALLERLTERRGELDAYAQELDLRAALIDAAEQRIEERAATMEALEAQISGLVEQRAAAESELMTGLIAMYETMRPRDAATIFNDLDIDILVQLARAMPPRKMAPILAEMNPLRAQDLTVRLASAGTSPSAPITADISELPQIVGQ